MAKDYTFTSTQREIVSGLTAGCMTTIVTHPLDLLKIRLQLDVTSKSHIESLKKVVRSLKADSFTESLRNTYRGITPNLIGSPTAWAIYFASYRQFKDLSHGLIASNDFKKDSNLQSWHYLGSAFAAGSFTAIITNPIWVLKTRILSTSRDSPGAYNGVFDGIQRVLKEEGIFGFWKGLVPSILGVSQGALQFTIYDTLKYQYRGDDSSGKLQIWEYILMSCTSKIISTTLVYPCQLLRSRLQDYKNIKEQKTTRQIIQDVYLKEGLRGFYKGIAPNIVRVLPATCITFSVYEQMKQWT